MINGRKPRPLDTLRLVGSRSARVTGTTEMQPDPGVPDAPAELTGQALTEWTRMAALLSALRVLSMADRAALTGYCIAWARWLKAEAMLSTEGEVIKAPTGYPIQNPWLAISNKASDETRRWANELGATPAARGRVHPVAAKTRDNLADFRLNSIQ